MILIYVRNMFLQLLFFTPIYILSRIIYIKIKKLNTTFKKEFALGIFILYIFGLLSQTVFPKMNIGIDDNTGFYFDVYINPNRQYNIRPFRTISEYLFSNNNNVSNWDKVSMLNLAANLALFMPFGFLLPLNIQKFKSYKKVFICSILLILSIEFIQYFIGRSSDIDDVILNMLGVTLGYLAYKIFNKIMHLKNN